MDSGVGPNSDLNLAGGVSCLGVGLTTGCVVGGYGDALGHGTHVAGIIAGSGRGGGPLGVAPGARIWSVKVIGADGGGTLAGLIAGLDWVAQQPQIAVVNLSLGAPGDSLALDEVLSTLTRRGVVEVAAAGNGAGDAAGFSPANDPNVIAVSALADYDGQPGGRALPTCAREGSDDSLASFSNDGAVVALAAPGVCIRSTLPGGTTAAWSGTSMAAPFVAGAAALYISAHDLPDGPERPARVRDGLTHEWAVPQSSACGFQDGDGREPLLMLAPCALDGSWGARDAGA